MSTRSKRIMKELIVSGEYTYYCPNSDLHISTGVLESVDLASDEIELRFKYRPNLFWHGTRAQFEKYWG